MSSADNIVRSSLLTTVATVATMLASFLSQVVIAKLFGAAAELDAYLTAGALPLALTGVLMAAVGYVTIPILTECRDDPAGLERMTGHFLALVLGLAALIALGGSLFARPLVHWTAPHLRPDKLALAEHLQPYFWGATAILLVTSFLTSLRHFRRQFVLPSLSGALVFLALMGAGLGLATRLGVRSLALGYLAGAALQCIVLLPVLRQGCRAGAAGLRSAWQRFSAAALPVMGSLLPFTLWPVIDAYWASRLPDGSLSTLGYASRIVIALAQITVQGLGIVLFPFLADDAMTGQLEQVRRRLRNALKFILVVQVPILALLTVLRVPVLSLLLERGHFDRRATLALAAVLPWYLVGMVGMAAMNIIVRGFYAVSRPRTLALLGLACLGVYAAVAGALSSVFSYVGIGIAYAVYWTLLSVLAAALLGKHVGGLWRAEDLRFAAKLGVIAAAAGVIVYGLEQFLPVPPGALGRLIGLGLVGSVSCAALGCALFDAQEIRLITSVVRPGLRGAAE